MIGQLVVLLVVAAGAGAYLKWSRVKRFWANRGVPHNKPHPIFGSLSFLQKENPAVFFRRIYEQFPNTPYMGIWLFWRPALVVNTPELARRILIKDNVVFRNRFLGSGNAKIDPIGGLNLFTSNDPWWSPMRRRLTPLFTSSKLKSLHNLNLTKAKQLSMRIKTDVLKNKTIELRNVFTDYATDLITIASFGIESNSVINGESPMRTITGEFMTYSLIRGVAWSAIFFFPELVKLLRFTLFPESFMRILKKVYHTVVADRGGYTDEVKHNDMVDVLRKAKYDADQKGEEMPEEGLISQSGAFLQGGFDTSATTLAFTSVELANQPELQEKVYREVAEAKAKLNGGDFEGNMLAELPYLNACIKETLRKFTPMGWIDRMAEKDYQVDEKLTIPAGTPVYVNAVGMQFDPKYFPEPDRYNPERFLPENEKNIPAFTYLPFGEGPRICIGMRFAQRSLRYAFSHLILNFEVKPKPGVTKRPNEYLIDRRGMFLAPGEPMYVDFIPRNKA